VREREDQMWSCLVS